MMSVRNLYNDIVQWASPSRFCNTIQDFQSKPLYLTNNRETPEILDLNNTNGLFPFSALPIEMQMEIVGYLDRRTVICLSKVCYSLKDIFSQYLEEYPKSTCSLVTLAISAGRIDKVIERFKAGNNLPLTIGFRKNVSYTYDDYVRILDCFRNANKVTIPLVFAPSNKLVYFKWMKILAGWVSLCLWEGTNKHIFTHVKDDVLRLTLAKCHNLSRLTIPYLCTFTSEVFNDIPEQPSIKAIRLLGGDEDAIYMSTLFQKFTALKKLSFHGFTVEKFKEEANEDALQRLRQVYLFRVGKFEEEEFIHLMNFCPKIKKIGLGLLFPITEIGLMHLGNGAMLKNISLYGISGCTDKVLEQVSTKCPHLTELDLRLCNGITDAGIQKLTRLLHLKRIMLWGTKTTITSLGDVLVDRVTPYWFQGPLPSFATDEDTNLLQHEHPKLLDILI